MIILTAVIAPLAITGAFGMLALKFGAEDRPGFNERAPLS
jgi:hypothetical protein